MLLEEIKGKRVLIGFVGASSMLDMTVARVDDLDDKFMKVSVASPKKDKHDISPSIVSYITIDSVNSITDIDSDASFDIVKRQLAKQVAAQQQAAQQQAAATGAPTPNITPTPKPKDTTDEEDEASAELKKNSHLTVMKGGKKEKDTEKNE